MAVKKINWKKGPGFAPVTSIHLPLVHTLSLDNAIPLVSVNTGTADIFKLEIVLRGGRFLEHIPLASKINAAMMREGTLRHTSPQIAEKVDYFGASLRMGSNLDFTFISLSGLSKHSHHLLSILQEIYYEPTYPDSELSKYKKNSIDKLNLDLAKNDIISYRLLTEAIFGNSHAYGYNTTEAMIHEVTSDDLRRHKQESFGSDNALIFVAGKYDEHAIVSQINANFGQQVLLSKPLQPYVEPSLSAHYRLTEASKNEHQASIKIGRKLFNRQHQDYATFFILNTILGGYFGSRLMSEIREGMALTYNIASAFDTMIYDGYFYIETEVDVANVDKTIDAIYVEIDKLMTSHVDEEELTMVKNYIIGNFLNLVDGPLNVASFLRSLHLDHVTMHDFDVMVAELRAVTPEAIMTVAKKYLDRNHLIEIIVKPK